MLDQDHKHVADYLYNRHELRETLERIPDAGCVQRVIDGRRAVPRMLFQVTREDWIYEVRRQLLGLDRLREAMAESGVDFGKNRGLWRPVVADREAGDTQVNITISDSWCTRTLSADEIAVEMVAPQDSPDRETLERLGQQYREFRVCRLSGKHFRIAIRGDHRGNPEGPSSKRHRDLLNLHEFALVLGDVPVNLPVQRVRPKRSDAWRGVLPPLMTFYDHRAGKWLVYPPKGG